MAFKMKGWSAFTKETNLPEEEQQAGWSRFTYQYKDKKNIVNGLKELYNCVKFITSDKPTKKQKRNDYED